MYNYLLIRYGELTLKSKNRKMFIRALEKSIKNTLKPFNVHVSVTRDRTYIDLKDENVYSVIDALKYTSGILSVSPVLKMDKSESAMIESAKQLIGTQEGDTFKVEVKRADKTYHLDTYQIQKLIGSEVLRDYPHLKVDVKHPDIEVAVEVRKDANYMYVETIQMMGGLPYGTGGKALLMLSGGIDSPVAGFEVMRKGIEIEAIHFHSPPYTSDQSIEKVKTLTKIMSKNTGHHIKLHIVPFTKLQTLIYDAIPDNLSMTTTRRVMLTIAERLARKLDAKAIVNGENLGQVASQTLMSMHAINEVTHFPVLRPLLTHEKNDIIKLAEQYGTFETSILPYEDCCTIFKPKSPKTKPQLEKVLHFEEKVNFEALIGEALTNIEVYDLNEEESIKTVIDELI